MRRLPEAARVAAASGSAILGLCLVAWGASVAGVSVVGGASMAPTFLPGDVIVFARAVPRVSVGDIVVARRPGWPAGVAHRVVSVGSAGLLVTRGDANPTPDREPLMPASIVGKVVWRVPSGRAAREVATLLRRWYTHVPIAQQAMTEMRPAR